MLFIYVYIVLFFFAFPKWELTALLGPGDNLY